MPALFMERGNITVSLLGRALGRRAWHWLDIFGQTLALIFIGAVALGYGRYAADLEGRHTVIIALELEPAAWAATALLGLAALAQILVIVGTATTMRKGTGETE